MNDSTNEMAVGLTMGIDLGNMWSHYCVVDAAGKVVEKGKFWTARVDFELELKKRPKMRVVIEAGGHSPWVSRLVKELGHEVLVANPRKVRAIFESNKKNDKADAETLARIGRMDPKLLAPVVHRGSEAQVDLAVVRGRDALVRARTMLVNHVRGAVKAFGGAMPKSSTRAFPKLGKHVPKELWPALSPLLDTIGALSTEITKLDKKVESLAEEKYPETKRLLEVGGVGALTSVAFVLTIDDPRRFESSRQVGAYLGLSPKQDDSGDTKRQLGITKAGDVFLRRLLVGSAQYILGPFGKDCDLRRWGNALMKRGGKNAKKRAAVAVARKVAVLLHRLWVTQTPYDALRNTKRGPSAVQPVPTPA